MTFDERAWLGDPAAETRKKRVPESAAARAARAHGARPFPVAAAKVLTLTATDEFSVTEVVAALESDAPMAARVLRLVNSPSFALRTRCTSIRQAVALLGRKGVREAAIAGSVLNLFPGDGKEAWNALHEHATTVGALARHLAPEWRVAPDEMFTAAFLHDIGKWILLEQEAEYGEVVEQNHSFEGTLDEERGRFGFDHAELTEHMLKAWAIPHPIPRVVGLHHDPASAYAESSAVGVRVAILRLADRLAYAMTADEELDFDALAATEPMTYLGMSAASLRERYAHLRKALLREDGEATPERPSLAPAPITVVAAKVTEEDEVCATCGQSSFGARCRRCDGRMCDEHEGPSGLCAGCEVTFTRELSRQRVPSPLLAAGLGVAGAAISLVSLGLGDAKWALLLPGAGLVVAAVVGTLRRLAVRARFIRPAA